MATVGIRLGIILLIRSFSSSFFFLFLFPEKIPGMQETVSFSLSLSFFSGYNNMFYVFIDFVQWKLKAFVID